MQWWSYQWGQLFSKQNQPWPSMLDSSIIPGAHQKLASIKWHYLHERQLPNNPSPTPPFNLQSRACKKKEKGEEREDIKRERNFCKGCSSSLLLPVPFPALQVKLLSSLFCNILGGFSGCVWKLVTKQHVHTFYPNKGSLRLGTREG